MAERILVVDDEEIIRESIAMILEKEGYKVDKAENGGIAFDKISSMSYDLVISDIEMPVMRGVELLEKITQRSPQTFFIIITAYASVETAVGAQDVNKTAIPGTRHDMMHNTLLFTICPPLLY